MTDDEKKSIRDQANRIMRALDELRVLNENEKPTRSRDLSLAITYIEDGLFRLVGATNPGIWENASLR